MSVNRERESSIFWVGCFIGLVCGMFLAVGATVGMMKLTVGNEEFIARKRAQGEERAKHVEEFFGGAREDMKRTDKEKKRADESFLKDVIPADMDLYAQWMRDWLVQGNELDPTLGFNDDLGPTPFYQITDGAVITPLYGSNRVMVIAPKGTDFTIEATGHNVVFYWDETGAAKWAGWGDPHPVLTPEVQARLEKMHDPLLDEALKKNLAKRRR